MLYLTNSGPYATRSELLFAFITAALKARVNDEVIIAACLDATHAGCSIYQHCQENGGRNYVEKQIKKARKKMAEGAASAVGPTPSLR